MPYYRYDGTPTTPMREIALTVSTLGLWVGYSLIMEAWYLYMGPGKKQKQLRSAAVPPAPPPRRRYLKPRRSRPPEWPQLSRRRPDPEEDDARD